MREVSIATATDELDPASPSFCPVGELMLLPKISKSMVVLTNVHTQPCPWSSLCTLTKPEPVAVTCTSVTDISLPSPI